MNKELVVAFLSAAGISLSISTTANANDKINTSLANDSIKIESLNSINSAIELLPDENKDDFKGNNSGCSERNNRCR
ncbi:hypothetical protein [Silvanigrella sp.]|jgi:hypothetical protein|uniref:hypothetical protein n=1 Tax=Silvanigrella sp. TaxID=2024976 RepID=UPI0037CA98F9